MFFKNEQNPCKKQTKFKQPIIFFYLIQIFFKDDIVYRKKRFFNLPFKYGLKHALKYCLKFKHLYQYVLYNNFSFKVFLAALHSYIIMIVLVFEDLVICLCVYFVCIMEVKASYYHPQ